MLYLPGVYVCTIEQVTIALVHFATVFTLSTLAGFPTLQNMGKSFKRIAISPSQPYRLIICRVICPSYLAINSQTEHGTLGVTVLNVQSLIQTSSTRLTFYLQRQI